jgi:hypothetical protein
LFVLAEKRLLRVARRQGLESLNIETDEEQIRNPCTR